MLAARAGIASPPASRNNHELADRAQRRNVANTTQRPAVGNYRVLYFFKGIPDGFQPSAALTPVNGTLYGTTGQGGEFASGLAPFGAGTVFKISTSGNESVLHSFGSDLDGVFPASALINVDGVLYGTTGNGGAHQICSETQDFGDICYGGGTAYAIETTGAEHIVYNFNSNPSDGATPDASLVYAKGVLYGTTDGGGSLSGTLFGVSLRGAERVLYSFGTSPTDASSPNDLLLVNGAGYGTSQGGGAFGAGTIYEFSKSGERVLYNFKGSSDGAGPDGLLFTNGAFYGTTYDGGAYGAGTLFAFNGLAKRVLYNFKGGTDGQGPNGGLIFANGVFYGTTYGGGASGTGTIFKITASGIETVLHSFKMFDPTDGANPMSGLTYFDGSLYGTTSGGGIANCRNFCGTVFRLTP